jgi:hypothetical protein
MKRMYSAVMMMLTLTTASQALATYDSNTVGRITNVLTYDDGHFLISLDPMPAGPCSNYFIIGSDVSVDGRQMLLSRALTAYSKGEPINIGYDGHTCVNGWYRVHRIG